MIDIAKILKEVGQKAQYLSQASIGEYIEFNKRQSDKSKWFTGKERLQLRSGRLFKSFAPVENEDGFNELKINDKGFEISLGSRLEYAAIHEYGGFIKSKGRMHKYFWYKYSESKNAFYKIMALSVLKRGGVNIPKREYFSIALKSFEKKHLPVILQQFIDKFRDMFIKDIEKKNVK